MQKRNKTSKPATNSKQTAELQKQRKSPPRQAWKK